MKNVIFALLMTLLLFSCGKKHDDLFGAINISGKITDIVSGKPISNCQVFLYSVILKNSLFSRYRSRVGQARDILTTDSTGNYAFSFNANGQYEFEIAADPNSPQYIKSDLTSAENIVINKIGPQIRNLNCNRSAFAKIFLKNLAPIDTVRILTISCYNAGDIINLKSFYRDSTVYLKLLGKTTFINSITLNRDTLPARTFSITAGPSDTIELQIDY